MAATARLAERACAVGLLGAVVFNAPLIRVGEGLVAGLPGLFLYAFAVWGLVIALMALAMRSGHLGGG